MSQVVSNFDIFMSYDKMIKEDEGSCDKYGFKGFRSFFPEGFECLADKAWQFSATKSLCKVHYPCVAKTKQGQAIVDKDRMFTHYRCVVEMNMRRLKRFKLLAQVNRNCNIYLYDFLKGGCFAYHMESFLCL